MNPSGNHYSRPAEKCLDSGRSSGTSGLSLHPLWLLGGLLLVIAGARVISHLPFRLPACGLRTLTGIPCPLCGSTRTLVAWSHLDLTQAFLLNPLIASGVIALCGWLLLRLADFFCQRNWTGRLLQWIRRKPWPFLLAAAVLANWIYLVLRLPG